MSLKTALNEINQLNVEEKLREIPVPEWHKKELDKRMADYEQNPTNILTWEELKSRIKNRII